MAGKTHYEQLIDEKFRGVYDRMELSNEKIELKLDNILSKVTTQNGHVSELCSKYVILDKRLIKVESKIDNKKESWGDFIKNNPKLIVMLVTIALTLLGVNVFV